jgi:GLPGLI family protein
MKKILCLLFFIPIFNFSQNFEVVYNFSITDNKDEYGTFGFSKLKLITNSVESNCYGKNIDTLLVIPNTDITHEQTATNYSLANYKNITESTFYSPTLFKENFLKDAEYAINWEINDNKRVILDYECQEATGSYRGRDYKVYFTSQIPIQNGPSRFDNLPGLVLEVISLDGYVHYSAISVAKSIEKIINPYLDKKFITWEEFRIMYEKYFYKMINYKPDENTTIVVPNRGVELYMLKEK